MVLAQVGETPFIMFIFGLIIFRIMVVKKIFDVAIAGNKIVFMHCL